MQIAARLLGPFSVSIDGRVVELAAPDATLSLLAALLLARGRPTDRRKLSERLYRPNRCGNPLYGLRQSVYSLKGLLARAVPQRPIVATTKASVGLDPSVTVSLDVDTYERLIAKCHWRKAAELYAPLLDEAWADDDSGVQLERRRLAALQATVLERLICSELSEGNFREVSRWSCELLRLDPSRQDLLPSIVSEVRREGGRSSSVRLCRSILECLHSLDEVAIAELDGEYRSSIGSVPPENSRDFFGRDRDIQALAALLEENRCVTLCGPHGIGKSRLAVRLAHELASRFEDGVWFVDSEAPEPASGRTRLLIFDGWDRKPEACACLVSAALESGARCLIASRHPIGIEGETVWRLDPLNDTTAKEFLCVRGRLDPAAVDERNVAELVRLLDGIPLLLELAAARLRTMRPAELVRRLGKGIGLLKETPAGARELLESFARDLDQLTSNERRLFRRLGVFPSHFDAQTAAVVNGDSDVRRTAAALDRLTDAAVLHHLQDERYALLRPFREQACALLEVHGEAPLCTQRLSGAVFLFVAERAEALNGPAPQRAFDDVTERLPDIRATVEALIAAGDAPMAMSVLLALTRYWFDRGGSSEGARLLEAVLNAVGSDPYWRARGLSALSILTRNVGDFDRAHSASLEALAAIREIGSGRWIVLGSLYAANSLRMVGKFHAARNLALEAHRLSAVEGPYLRAFAEATLGIIELSTGDLTGAREWLLAALEGFRKSDAGSDAALALANLGVCALAEGNVDMAETLAREALQGYHNVGDPPYYVAHALELSSKIALRRGDLPNARRFARELLGLVDQLQDVELGIITAECIAQVNEAVGELVEAATLFAACDMLRSRYHVPCFPVDAGAIKAADGRCRAQLGLARYDVARAIGGGLDLSAMLLRARQSVARRLRRKDIADGTSDYISHRDSTTNAR